MDIKVNEGMLNRFLEIMDDYGEFVFGNKKYLRKQLETILNSQGYWSGCSIRVYYDKDTNDFTVQNRF